MNDYLVLLWRFVVVFGSLGALTLGALYMAWDAKGQPRGRFWVWVGGWL